MSISTKSVVRALALGLAAAGITAGAVATPASAHHYIGDTTNDRAGQVATIGSATCTVTAGDPVTTTINGRRYLQATNTVRCDRPVHFQWFWATMGPFPGNAYVSNAPRGLPNRTTASVVVRKPCSGSQNTTYSSYFEVEISNTNGKNRHVVRDASRWNLRSCGW